MHASERSDFEWTEEACALLLKRWADGASCTQIGAEMGISRSAIICKIDRLRRRDHSIRIRAEAKKPGHPRTTNPLGPPNKRSSFGTIGRTRPAQPVCEPDPVKRSELSKQAYGSPCDILNVTGCRWPTTDCPPHLFCNAGQVKDLPYCGIHARIAYGGAPKTNAKSLPALHSAAGITRSLPADFDEAAA